MDGKPLMDVITLCEIIDLSVDWQATYGHFELPHQSTLFVRRLGHFCACCQVYPWLWINTWGLCCLGSDAWRNLGCGST